MSASGSLTGGLESWYMRRPVYKVELADCVPGSLSPSVGIVYKECPSRGK